MGSGSDKKTWWNKRKGWFKGDVLRNWMTYYLYIDIWTRHDSFLIVQYSNMYCQYIFIFIFIYWFKFPNIKSPIIFRVVHWIYPLPSSTGKTLKVGGDVYNYPKKVTWTQNCQVYCNQKYIYIYIHICLFTYIYMYTHMFIHIYIYT